MPVPHLSGSSSPPDPARRNLAQLQPLIIGEVLFDCFADSRVLGGAPFNVAWNLQGLGTQPTVITSVGDDEFGQEVLQRACQWHLPTAGIQLCTGKPTGRVEIITHEGQPSYKFWDDVAFDHIRFESQFLDSLTPSLLYHGSLAMRGAVSRETILRLRASMNCPLFIDINIRLPHFDRQWCSSILHQADHVKLNHDELRYLLSIDQPESTDLQQRWQDRRELCRRLCDQFSISNLWLTAGEEGAAWLGRDGQWCCQAAPPVEHLVDTVGAGDALTAVIIAGLIREHSPAELLKSATQYAAAVCSLRGAISDDPQFYRQATQLLPWNN